MLPNLFWYMGLAATFLALGFTVEPDALDLIEPTSNAVATPDLIEPVRTAIVASDGVIEMPPITITASAPKDDCTVYASRDDLRVNCENGAMVYTYPPPAPLSGSVLPLTDGRTCTLVENDGSITADCVYKRMGGAK